MKVTSALLRACKEELTPERFNEVLAADRYSDSRRGKTAVGVKFCGVAFTYEELADIESNMICKGFTPVYIRYNSSGFRYSHGWRFCFHRK